MSEAADRFRAAEHELVDAAIALPYWPGSRTPKNYAPPLLRFLKARDQVIALARDPETCTPLVKQAEEREV